MFKIYDSIFSRELPQLFSSEEEAQQLSDELNALMGSSRNEDFWVVTASSSSPFSCEEEVPT